MSKKDLCEKPFWEDIGIIFRHFTLYYDPLCKHQIWNFGVRLMLVALFIGMIASIIGGLSSIIVSLVFGVITAFAIIITAKPTKKEEERKEKKEEEKAEHWDKYHELPYMAVVDPSAAKSASVKEHFVNGGSSKGSVQPVMDPIGLEEVDAASYSGAALPEFMPPTSRNPFMNILLDEIKYNPHRPPASSVSDPTVKQTFDDYFRVQWFSDPTDVFGKNQGQRQFVTQPGTSVPNDRESYQNWLYKIPGKTCKEGGREACIPATNGSPVTWLNQDS